MPLVTNYSLLINEVDPSDISDAIRNLKNTFSSGVDGIPSFIIKGCTDLSNLSEISNYRGASILPVFFKIHEHILFNKEKKNEKSWATNKVCCLFLFKNIKFLSVLFLC